MKKYVIYRSINGVDGYVTATTYLLYNHLDSTHTRRFTKEEVDKFLEKNKKFNWKFKEVKDES